MSAERQRWLKDHGMYGLHIHLRTSDCLIILFSEKPGSILRMTIADLTANFGQSISLHEFGIVETLKMAEQLGCAPDEVVIFGVRPEQISCGTELSEKVAAAVPKVIKLVLDELSQ